MSEFKKQNKTKQKQNKNACFQGSHFVCVWGGGAEGTVVLMAVCVGGSANEVCMEVTGYGDGCVGVGWVCVFGGVDGLVSEFWTSGIVLYVTISLFET